jgi:hypothetical protein
MMVDEEWFCCDAIRLDGFTYHQFVTVCDVCFTQFPYYDCFCELKHECVPNKWRDRRNDI